MKLIKQLGSVGTLIPGIVHLQHRLKVQWVFRYFIFVILFFICFSLMNTVGYSQGWSKPNVVIILADDLGYGDISCHGGDTPTPNIDKLFNQGVELGNFMTWCVCSPTRAGILTGLNPLRTGQAPNTDGDLSTKLLTIGKVFQQNEYKTGIFGKWHNSDAPKFYPYFPNVNDYGFDRWVGFYGGGADYFTKVWPNIIESPDWYHDYDSYDNEMEYATDLITNHAIDFINKNSTGNFLAYIPYNAVHSPFHIKKEDLQKVPRLIRERLKDKLRPWKEYYSIINNMQFPSLNKAHEVLYGDSTFSDVKEKLSHDELKFLYSIMLINLDENIGKLLDHLDRHGLSENTIVWFVSDNGAVSVGNNLPFRGTKHTMWEGGIHSPSVIRWPAGQLKGSSRYDGLAGYLDVMPTLMDMAGLKLGQTTLMDGNSIWPALQQEKPLKDPSYYYVWHDYDMIRKDKWKLFRYADHVELYELDKDRAESHNVSSDFPEVTSQLLDEMENWRRSTGVALMHVSPETGHELQPKPEGDVLEITIHYNNGKPLQKPIVVPLFSKKIKLLPGDYLEFDMLAESEDGQGNIYFTPMSNPRTLTPVAGIPLFNGSRGVDWNGQMIIAGIAPKKGSGKWEHKIIGLGNVAPDILKQFGVVLGTQGHFQILLDNIKIKRYDGSVISIWKENTERIIEVNQFKFPAGFLVKTDHHSVY